MKKHLLFLSGPEEIADAWFEREESGVYGGFVISIFELKE